MLRRPAVRALLVVVAVAFAAAVAAVVVRNRSEPAAPSPEAAAEFVGAYERSRTAVYVAEAEFTRTMADGRELTSGSRHVQRPPDRLQRELGAVVGRLGDRTLNCTTGPSGVFDCPTGGSAPPYDAQVAAEVDAVRSYVTGPDPAYLVRTAGTGCYELLLAGELPVPPYGTWTRMCFDAPTGALSYLEVRRDGSTDRWRAYQVRQMVTDVDLRLEPDERFSVAGEDGEPAGPVGTGGS